MAEINILKSTTELAEIMKSNPSFIEKNELGIGQDLLSLFQDDNFTDSFQNLKTLKREVLLSVAEDISTGGQSLKDFSFGVSFRNGKLETYKAPFGRPPEGSVVFSISQKNRAAFKNWRSQGEEDLSQEAINSTIYFLATALSKLI